MFQWECFLWETSILVDYISGCPNWGRVRRMAWLCVQGGIALSGEKVMTTSTKKQSSGSEGRVIHRERFLIANDTSWNRAHRQPSHTRPDEVLAGAHRHLLLPTSGGVRGVPGYRSPHTELLRLQLSTPVGQPIWRATFPTLILPCVVH